MSEPHRYVVVYEWAGSNYAAHVPDLPGCISVGATLEECEKNIREAIELHLEGLREAGESVPPPSARVGYVDVG
jgi:predicted RNase H-like HicB family nuclease